MKKQQTLRSHLAIRFRIKRVFTIIVMLLYALILKAQEQAKPADAFVETIGIGDRFDFLNDGGLLPKAQIALSSLKIRYLRMGIAAESGSSTFIPNAKSMASALGVKLCIVTDVFNTWSTQQAWLNTWRGYAGTYAVEGPNEVGNRPTVAALQQNIWNYAKPLGMDVYAWTLGAQAGYYRKDGIANGGATVDNYCDYLNFHPYHWYTLNYSACKMNGLWQNGDFDNLGFGTGGCIEQVRAMANNPTKPFVSTEFGWCINGLEQGVGINFAKKYVVRNCFENFNAGMHRGFIFSLTETGGGAASYALASSATGALNATGQTIANTISLLQEPGKNTIPTTSLTYSLTNISSTVGQSALTYSDDRLAQNDEIHHTLLQKSNGVFYLVLWCDYDSHNGEDGWAQNATLTLPSGATSVRAYLPLNGTNVVKDFGSVASGGTVSLNSSTGTAIPDHPLVIEITTGPVSNVAVTGVSVSPNTASVTVGANTTLTRTIAPSNATNQNVTWSSSNTAIATVDANGVVTGIAAGSATITVTTVDGSKTATSAITVTAPTGGSWTIVDDAAPGWTYVGFSADATCSSCYNGTNHNSTTINQTATYTFTGTNVEAYCETWNGAGSVQIHIDGVLKGTYAQNITPYGGAQKFATITGLTNASHTIRFTSTARKAFTSIDYIRFAVNPTAGSRAANIFSTLNAFKDIPSVNAIEIYPNPAGDFAIINLKNKLNGESYFIEVTDVLGKRIFNSGKLGSEPFYKLNMGNYAAGTYIISVICGKQITNHKLVKN